MIDANKMKTLDKVFQYKTIYKEYVNIKLAEIRCCKAEGNHSMNTPPSDSEYVNIEKGEKWGGEQVYAWFKGTVNVDESMAGKGLWLLPEYNAAEGLLYIDGKPRGMFDWTPEVENPQFRLHEVQPLTDNAKLGETFNFAIESYAGQTSFGCMPFETIGNCDHFYPYNTTRIFNGIYVCEIDKAVEQFIYKIDTLEQLYKTLPDSDFMKYQIINTLEEVFKLLPYYPNEYPFADWHKGIEKANELMQKIFDCKDTDEEGIFGKVGLIGHSHLDTAWQWPVRETVHKAARTFSQALAVMRRYPEYKFIQSSAVYLDWMKKRYPDIFEEIKQRTAEGRWEPNGGSWVECDGNMTGAECLVRQFVRGQRFLKDNLNYKADAFWQPDTFGYSAAIPQIMKGCGLKYFLTTKLSWNECNHFPYDSFIWRGIDGSEVLTHFNITHCHASAAPVIENTNGIAQKDVTDMKLISYGYGDGGGGPSYSMLEEARLIKDLKGLPKTKHTTVSRFMQKLEKTARNLPVYDGELYLELHRGTLTQKHDIKRSNRKLEVALRNLEAVNSHLNIVKNTEKNPEIINLYDALLLNQFHDILPGTSLQEVHELAIKQNYQNIEKANAITNGLLDSDKKDNFISFYNPLSWDFDSVTVIEDENKIPLGTAGQKFTDLNGNKKIAVKGVRVAPLSSKSYEMTDYTDNASPFVFDGKTLKTPFAEIKFAENGGFKSFAETETGRELVKDKPLNTFYFGEDVPYLWDNWDIDLDQKLKMREVNALLSTEVVSDGAVEFRIRNKYKIGQHSTLVQDVIFYADSPKIDFESKIDWKEKHSLLKTSFNVDLRANFTRHDIQFGFVERANNSNTSIERSKFEVCNHKWTDISESNFGAAILNDCKYGISVDNSDMRLTLHKAGCHPDTSGDTGVHEFTYSFLPHRGEFNAQNVVKPAYELNIPLIETENSGLELPSIVKIDKPNIVVETVKFAEDNDGIVLRIYESECARTAAELDFGVEFLELQETNMLEDETINTIPTENGKAKLIFKPFEIKTLKLKRK